MHHRRIQYYFHFIFEMQPKTIGKEGTPFSGNEYMLRISWKLTNCYSLLFLCNPKIETTIIPFSRVCVDVHLEDIINNNERRTKENIYYFFSLLLQCVSVDSTKSIRNLSDIIPSSSTRFVLSMHAIVHAVPLHHFQLSPKTYFSTLAQRPACT